MKIEQTSAEEVGQVYLPVINWTLMIACIGLVLGFGSSSNLAAAYGVGVTTDMVFTTLLFAVVLFVRWNWSLATTIGITALFLIIDLAFWGANIIKVPGGGWFPLVIAAVVFTLMTTWKKGRNILNEHLKSSELPLQEFMGNMAEYTETKEEKIKEVDGTAIYMYSNPEGTPPALLNNVKFNKVLHKNIILLSVDHTDEQPYVAEEEKIRVEKLSDKFYRIIIKSGFAENVDIPSSLDKIVQGDYELSFDMQETTFFLGKEQILPTDKEYSDMSKWRDRLFSIMVRNEQQATAYFNLPTDRVVEVGTQIKM
jgi:KUP system potassium uptake protein